MTAILGPTQATVAQAQAWAEAQGALADMAALSALWWQLGPARGGVRPEVGFAQACKETGFFRFGGTDPVFSASAAMCNPAGLKTADGTATATFPDWATGITAQLDHLALYAGAPGYPVAGTPDLRAFPSLAGECPTVESLSGHWAPAADYGSSIVADYLTPLIATPSNGVPMSLVPFATYRPVVNHSGPMSAHLGLVVHVQVGDNSCYGEFNNPAAQASSTWWISKTGVLEQYVDADEIAWAEMAGNGTYDSVETEGLPTEPWTAAQEAMLARLIVWGHQTYGWPLVLVDHGGSGVTTHAHYPSGIADPAWGNHDCPGPLRAGRLPAVMAAAAVLAGAPVTSASPPSSPPAGPTYPSGGPMTVTEYAGMARTPTGKGYWLAKSDGSIITEGDATYLGGANVDSTGKPVVLNAPIVGIAAHPTEPGYWLVGSDGGVFAYGACVFHGSAGGLTLAAPIKGIEATPTADGYWLDAGDGGIFSYGDAVFEGSGAGQ